MVVTRFAKAAGEVNLSMLKLPPVTPFVECPNCHRLLGYGLQNCPYCREEISEEYALASAAVHIHLTQACSLANSIKTGEPAVVIIGIGSLYAFALGWPALFSVTLIGTLISLLAVSLWFIRFGRIRYGDEDYLKARRQMKASRVLWLALLGAQIICLIYLSKTS